MIEKTASNRRADIYIAGDYARAVEICERFCTDNGYCVTVDPTTFVYKFGKEQGVRVGLIDYPRFPQSQGDMEWRARQIADLLLTGLNQGSYTIVGPMKSIFVSRREQDQ